MRNHEKTKIAGRDYMIVRPVLRQFVPVFLNAEEMLMKQQQLLRNLQNLDEWLHLQ